MTRKELYALMTGAVALGKAAHYGAVSPVVCAELALELLEAAEEVYARSEGFSGSIEALEVAARAVLEQWGSNHPCLARLKNALDALEPSSE